MPSTSRYCQFCRFTCVARDTTAACMEYVAVGAIALVGAMAVVTAALAAARAAYAGVNGVVAGRTAAACAVAVAAHKTQANLNQTSAAGCFLPRFHL